MGDVDDSPPLSQSPSSSRRFTPSHPPTSNTPTPYHSSSGAFASSSTPQSRTTTPNPTLHSYNSRGTLSITTTTLTSAVESKTKMSASGNIAPTPTPWVRPTACAQPNPSRKRTTPIAFASNAFDPRGWSVPPTPSVLEPETSPLDATAVHDALLEAHIGAPAIIHAPVNTHTRAHTSNNATHPPRKRTEPIGFAKAAFDPRGWAPPSVLGPAASFSSSASTEADEIIESPTDSILLDRPVLPSRSRTEPIVFASNGWNTASKPAPGAYHKTFSPVSPTNSAFEGWSPVYTAETPSRIRTPPKPCAKWMEKSLALPVSRQASLQQSDQQLQQSHHPQHPVPDVKIEGEGELRTPIDLLKPERIPHRRSDSNDSNITIRPSTYKDSSSSSASSAISGKASPSSKWHEYKVQLDPATSDTEHAGQEIALHEIPVSTLHPNIVKLSRRSTPSVPTEIIEAAINLGLRPGPALAGAAEVADPSKPAVITPLAQALAQHDHAGDIGQVNLNRLDDDLLAIYSKRKAEPTYDGEPTVEDAASVSQRSLTGLRRLFCVPSAPRSSPLIGAKDVLVPAADLDLDSDPFANWAASASRREGHFDIDSVSAKLRESALENNDDGEAGYLLNKADKATSSG